MGYRNDLYDAGEWDLKSYSALTYDAEKVADFIEDLRYVNEKYNDKIGMLGIEYDHYRDNQTFVGRAATTSKYAIESKQKGYLHEGVYNIEKAIYDKYCNLDDMFKAIVDPSPKARINTDVIENIKCDYMRQAETADIVGRVLENSSRYLEQEFGDLGQVTQINYNGVMLTALRSNFRQISNVLQEGVDTDGGYLVPEEYDKRIIDVLTEENIFRGLATTIRTSGEHKINIAATKPAAAWIEEGEQLTFGDATFDQMFLDAHKLHVAIKVTEELLYDNAFGLENYIITQFGKALGNAEEDAFLNGNGGGQPTGIFHATKGGQIFGTTAAQDKIAADELINLIYGLKRPYRKKASFILNDKTVGQIRTLKDNNGAYIWQPSYQAGEPDKILGYTIHTSAYAPTNCLDQIRGMD